MPVNICYYQLSGTSADILAAFYSITKITYLKWAIKLKFERSFIVIFVIVKHNWKIWCGFLIVDELVFDKIRQDAAVQNIFPYLRFCPFPHLKILVKYSNYR